jgi:hypothetical protein
VMRRHPDAERNRIWRGNLVPKHDASPVETQKPRRPKFVTPQQGTTQVPEKARWQSRT